MIPEALIAHLWQSTVFALGVAALTLLFRRNRAAVRFAMWMTASVKFLVPFSLIVAAASYCAPPRVNAGAPLSSGPTLQIVTGDAVLFQPSAKSPVRGRFPLGVVLVGVWLCGVSRNGFVWWRQWRRVQAMLLGGVPFDAGRGVRAVSAPGVHEPAVFGVLRPVLLVPEGLRQRLTAEQWQAVLEHEVAHVHRWDNLWAAVHMVVEAIFWFHPLVWWLEARLLEERERACDETVLAGECSADVYAEGILTVCKWYAETPMACVSGIGGSSLKKRIETIFRASAPAAMTGARKAALASVALAVVGVPAWMGVLHPSRVQAQTGPKAKFEVASVKRSEAQGARPIGWDVKPGGRFHAAGLPLMMLIAVAYDLPFQSDRLSGGPDWLRVEQYDIDAAPEKDAIPPGIGGKALDARVRPMLQSLLADRFHLVLRRETKDYPVYEVSVAKGGLKLTKSALQEADCDKPSAGCHALHGGLGRGMNATAADLDDLSQFASNWTDRPLVNRTGVAGLFEIKTEGWARMTPLPPPPDGVVSPEAIALSDPARPTVFEIFQRMGLKLTPAKGPLDVYVVEQIERPTEN